MKASRARRRVPRREASSTSASRISNGGTPSAAGDALQTLPAIVPRFWIWTAPMSRAATFSASKAGGRSAIAISLHVVRRADTHRVAFEARAAQRGYVGHVDVSPSNGRSPALGKMSVAPAMTRASPPASNPSASSRSEGRAYMRAAHASDVCIQMIERNQRVVKDLCEFGTCQTLAAPGGERSIAPDQAGASAKDCLSLSLQASQKSGRRR